MAIAHPTVGQQGDRVGGILRTIAAVLFSVLLADFLFPGTLLPTRETQCEISGTQQGLNH